MGNGAAAIQARAVVDYTKPKIIWRRDGSDIELIKSLFRAEEDELLREKHSQHEIDIYMKIYMKGVMQMRDGMIDLIKQDLIPANEKAGFDPDHWFEINLSNAVLFPHLNLEAFGELLPGRLFTTRMPRNINNSPYAATKFKRKKEKFELHTALILTEKDEYVKYAGTDLEAFYKSIGIETINRPIHDFGTPEQSDIVKDIKEVTWRLAHGLNVLVHCAGGNGRTGMVIAAVIKNAGVQRPIQFIRQVKSTYVETKEQEDFVNSLPAVVDAKLSAMYPDLASVMALGTLKLAMEQYHAVTGAGDSKRLPATIEELGLTAEQVQDYSATFELYDKDSSGFISKEELSDVLTVIGADISVFDLFKSMDKDNDGRVSKLEFLLAMADGHKKKGA